MTGLNFPRVYLSPLALPLAWEHEGTGELRAAVKAYYDEALGKSTMEPMQLAIIAGFIDYHINAPCWLEKHPEVPDIDFNYALVITQLRERAAKLAMVPTFAAIAAYIEEADKMNLDPL